MKKIGLVAKIQENIDVNKEGLRELKDKLSTILEQHYDLTSSGDINSSDYVKVFDKYYSVKKKYGERMVRSFHRKIRTYLNLISVVEGNIELYENRIKELDKFN